MDFMQNEMEMLHLEICYITQSDDRRAINKVYKVFLWVLEENHNARHFYEKCGFVQTERCLYSDIGGRELKEVQYCYQNT